MNSTFQFDRWLLLVKQHWAENRKRYLLAMLALAGLLIMWFSFRLIAEPSLPMDKETQVFTYYFLLFASGSFFASQFFRDLSSRSRGINFLLIPASSFEKFLCSFLVVVVLYFITYTAIFYTVDALMVMIANSVHPDYNQPGATKAVVESAFAKLGNLNGTPYIFAAYFAVQSAFLLGSIYFQKYSLVKTCISIFSFFLFIYLTQELMMEIFLPKGSSLMGLTSFVITNKASQQDVLIALPDWVQDLLEVITYFGFSLWFWWITYNRLKEKEV